MRLSQSEVLEMASAEGFDPPALEKVLHLMNLLNMLNAHPYLKGKWILKGGTALNLFLLRMPRLSVDIDLNYVGTLDRETMLDERPRIEQAVQAVCSREGFNVRRVPTEHAGGKWVHLDAVRAEALKRAGPGDQDGEIGEWLIWAKKHVES